MTQLLGLLYELEQDLKDDKKKSDFDLITGYRESTRTPSKLSSS